MTENPHLESVPAWHQSKLDAIEWGRNHLRELVNDTITVNSTARIDATPTFKQFADMFIYCAPEQRIRVAQGVINDLLLEYFINTNKEAQE